MPPCRPCPQRVVLRWLRQLGSPVGETTLTVERGLDALVIAAIAAGADATAAMKHADQNLSDGQGQLTPESFAALVGMEADGSLSSTQVKTVLGELVANGGQPADIAATMGFEAMDTSELETLLDGIIADSPDEWARFVEGDRKVQGHFVGQIMKATQGKADGKVVNQLMTQRASQA